MCDGKAYVILHRNNKANIYRGPYFYAAGKRAAEQKFESLSEEERKRLVIQKIPLQTAKQIVDQNRGIYD